MNVLYKACAVANGGRDGSVSVLNSSLQFEFAPPAEMGGSGEGVNPEQLFAAAYAACFGSAVAHVMHVKRIVADPPSVQLTVGIGENDGGFRLSVEIHVTYTGLSFETAGQITAEAHKICPFSNATRGNIEVGLSTEIK